MSGIKHILALHRTIDSTGKLRMVAEAQDEFVRADGVATRSPTYWIVDAKPATMIDADVFEVVETGERLLRELR